MPDEFDEIRRRLEGIAEELADLAIQRPQESIDAGGTEFPVDVRRLTRARRAVEKAGYLPPEPGGREVRPRVLRCRRPLGASGGAGGAASSTGAEASRFKTSIRVRRRP